MFLIKTCNIESLEILKDWIHANRIKNFIIKKDKEGNFNIVINIYDEPKDVNDDNTDILEELQLFEDALVSDRVHDYYFSYDNDTKIKVINKSFKDVDSITNDIHDVINYLKGYIESNDKDIKAGIFIKKQIDNSNSKKPKRTSLEELSILQLIDKIEELVFKED